MRRPRGGEVERLMRRLTLAWLVLSVIPAPAGGYDDPATGYLAARERLAPAPVSSRTGLREVLGSESFRHFELVGDVSGKASCAPSLDGHPPRTLMMTLDDGSHVTLQAGQEIDELRVGHRIAVIAGIARGGGTTDDLAVTEWVHEWDLPLVEPPGEAPIEPEQSEEPEQPEQPEATQVPAQRQAQPSPPRPAAANAPQADTVEVWRGWVLEQNSKLTDERATNIVRWVLHYSQEYDVNHKLIFALIKWESWFDPGCVSHAGAIGLMQLMPGTARYLGVNPRNVQQNIEGGTHYLAEQLATYTDRPNYERVILALACYNAGPNAVKRAGHCVPNITETQRYVKKVSNTFYELHQDGMP